MGDGSGRTGTRRDMLRGMLAGGAAIALPQQAFAGARSCIVQESGNHAEGPLVIAALKTGDLAACEVAIGAWRSETGFKRNLWDRRTDSARLPFMLGLIDLAAGMQVDVQIVDGVWPDGPADRDAIYFAEYDRLLGDGWHDSIALPPVTDVRGQLLRAKWSAHASQPSEAAQLAWLVASLVRADYLDSASGDRAIALQHLKSVLDVPVQVTRL